MTRLYKVRLTELGEAASSEEPGKFIMIDGLEMTTDPIGYSVHTNPMKISTLLEVEKNSNQTVQKESALHESLVHRHEYEAGNQFSGKPITRTSVRYHGRAAGCRLWSLRRGDHEFQFELF